MKRLLAIGCLLLAGVTSWAVTEAVEASTGPTGFLQDHDARVREVVMRAPADSLTATEREQVRKLINDAFDFRELTRRSLGDVWSSRTSTEQDEFVQINRGIIERRNLDLFVRYHRDGGITYTEELIDDAGLAVVTAEVPMKKERKVITYALHRPVEGGSWQVYDLVIDGASTVEGNRRTWTRYIARNSYEKLVEQLRKQLHRLEGNS